MEKPHPWMPVFIITTSRTIYEPQDVRDSTPKQRIYDEDLMRVGTAHRRDDGSYLVVLAALPTDGQLLLRAPRDEDAPTLAGRRP
jgi:hypothetical protein